MRKGKVGELQSHGDICSYKVIECGIEGCTLTCQRKDMNAHRSSNEALLRHMELKYDRKMSEMEAILSSRYSNKIRKLESDFDRRLIELESTLERENDERAYEIQSCQDELWWYKNKVDTLEQKVKILEKQLGGKKRQSSSEGALNSDIRAIMVSFGGE